MSTIHKHSIKEGVDGITHVVIEGYGDEYDAKTFVAEAEAIFEKDRHKIHNAIINMTESGDSTFEGLYVYKDFLKHKQLGKIAFILKDNPIVSMMVKMATLYKKKDVIIVETEQQARAWLKQQ